MRDPNSNISDEALLQSSLQGNKRSLEELLSRQRDFIYNLSLKMTSNKDDAADICQEVLIKVITKLSSFQGNSSFTTWLYRITLNHILNERKSTLGKRKMTFVQFGTTLDNTPDTNLRADEHYAADALVLTEETKQTCMTGMLMCLDEKHRIVFILAELFGIKDEVGKEVLGVTKENFRMMLSRAKKDLYNFMDNKCGLINRGNPCRCEKKTRSFIKAGLVDPDHRLFTGKYRSTMEAAAGSKQKSLEGSLYEQYRILFLQHHYLEGPDFLHTLNDWLASEEVRGLFNFN
jgi:RNA polymerase sigma factor (sigma-70 family)